MLHHSGRGVCMLLCLLWLTTSCHALSSGTVTHGLWRPDLQLPLLFVSGCLAYFHKDKHTAICFVLHFHENGINKWQGGGQLGAGFFLWGGGGYVTVDNLLNTILNTSDKQ